jgi:glycosyltransferase involved in cell wall biosynthesis
LVILQELLMSRIALLVPCLTDADAVSNDVLGMYETLEARGHEVCIFAFFWNISGPKIRHFTRIDRFLDHPSSLLIYHHSTGWGEALEIVRHAPCKRIVKYHNVTPPEFFEGIHPDYVNACHDGRRQLVEFARAGCDLYLFDSKYNMRELLFEGVDEGESAVVPPFHKVDSFVNLDADLGVLDSYCDGRTNVLSVARLAPNKGHLALLDAFAVYHHHYDPSSRLLLVGKEDERLSIYANSLRMRAQELDIHTAVVFLGEVSDRTLKTFYLVADVFMMTSEHEGFCVPIVEAMAMKVPVVAYGSSAVPGTVGKAGIVWDEPDPDLLAGSLKRVVADERTHTALAHMGRKRFDSRFSRDKIEDRFMKAIGSLL